MRSKRAVQAKLGMYLLGFSLAAALPNGFFKRPVLTGFCASLRMCRSESTTAESVMPDEPDGIAIMDQRIVAGDFLVDRDQHFFFADQLQQVAKLHALPLNDLPHRHG